MRKISEKEYLVWVSRFEDDSNIIFSLLNVIDNLIEAPSCTKSGVAAAAIACNARLLKERQGINWQGFYDWKEAFEEEL